MSEITFDEFMAVDVRVGEITRTEPFPEARKPAYKLWINFGAVSYTHLRAHET